MPGDAGHFFFGWVKRITEVRDACAAGCANKKARTYRAFFLAYRYRAR